MGVQQPDAHNQHDPAASNHLEPSSPESSLPDPWTMDMASPDAVIRALRAGAEANLGARCRRGSIDVVLVTPGTPAANAPELVATGDLHDNPMHFRRVCELAGLVASGSDDKNGYAEAGGPQHARAVKASSPTSPRPAHLTLHELIHGERLTAGMDMSYRVLARAAALKARFPEFVHTLLANHELAQIVGAGVMKNGVHCVLAFNQGVDYIFGEVAPDVTDAINRFIESMPLALRIRTGDGRSLLCAHSIPSPAAVLDGFDFTLLDRALRPDDLTPRTGSAHMLVWGRDYEDPTHLATVAKGLGANVLILGHELAEAGVRIVKPCAVVLNSDHDRGRAVRVNLAHCPDPDEIVRASVELATHLWHADVPHLPHS